MRPGPVGRRGARHELMPPEVPARGHGDLIPAALEHDDVLHAGGVWQGAIDACLELDDPAPAPAAVRGDDQLRLAVVDPVLDGLGTEAAENDGVHHPEPRARQHGHRRLGYHGHVDGRPVTFLQAERFEHIGKLADLEMQLAIGQRAHVTRLSFENNCRLVRAVGAEVPIETVLSEI